MQLGKLKATRIRRHVWMGCCQSCFRFFVESSAIIVRSATGPHHLELCLPCARRIGKAAEVKR